MADVIITPASGLIDFQNTSGISSATIQLDGNGNLTINAAAGNIEIGDTASDIFIGDGVANVDIVFEEDGEIRGLTGKTITLGQSDSFIAFAGDITGDVDFTGGLNVTGVSTFQGNVYLGDNDALYFGASNDLQIVHDGSNSWITDQGTGYLGLVSNGTGVMLQKQGGEFMGRFLTDGAVELYYDNSKKFETTSGGIEVTGSVTATNFTGNLYSTGISTISGFTFPASDGTSGQVLGTDGAGQLAFITASSAGSGTTITNLHWTVGVGSTAFQSPQDIEDGTALVFNNGLKLSLDEDYYIESNTVYIKNGPLPEGDRVHVTIHYDTSYESEFFTATDGQTTFNLAATLLSSQDRAKVYLNGAKLRGTIDYGISQTVNLNVGATEGDLINISADAGESYTSASSGQTAFSYTSSSITASNLIVYQNGIRLEPTDYTVGSLSLVLTQGAEAGDSLDVLLYA